jgi:dTDP-4-dehydrorhamnose reductase
MALTQEPIFIMKILLIGKTGRLGSDILRNNMLHQIYAPDRASFDICSRDTFDAVIDDYQPNVVVNTASFHDVPLCEADPLSAFMVNCVAARDLALACHRIGSLFVTFSTDYVFDGEKQAAYQEDDKPAPLQLYGISRLAGEYAALSAASENTIIIRTCGLYGSSGSLSGEADFIDQRIQDARTQASLVMGGDQVVSPTYTHDLSEAVLRLIEHPQRTPGIYHLVNEGKCSWYEFTRAIFEIMGLTVKLNPMDRSGKSGDMKRPLYTALANTKARALGIVLPPWRDALERYLVKKYQRSNGQE